MWKAVVLVAVVCVAPALAEDAPAVTVELKDGSRLVGTLVAEDGRACGSACAPVSSSRWRAQRCTPSVAAGSGRWPAT